MNKIDLEKGRTKIDEVINALAIYGKRIVEVSAVKKTGLDEMLGHVERELEYASRTNKTSHNQIGEMPIIKPQGLDKEKMIQRTKEGHKVVYSKAVRISRMIDNDNWAAKMQLYEMLKKWRVIQQLENAGLSRGQPFSVGKIDYEWE